MATDLAEVLGGAIALNLLLGLPLPVRGRSSPPPAWRCWPCGPTGAAPSTWRWRPCSWASSAGPITADRAVMGEGVKRRLTTAAVLAVTLLVTGLDLVLVAQTFAGRAG